MLNRTRVLVPLVYPTLVRVLQVNLTPVLVLRVNLTLVLVHLVNLTRLMSVRLKTVVPVPRLLMITV